MLPQLIKNRLFYSLAAALGFHLALALLPLVNFPITQKTTNRGSDDLTIVLVSYDSIDEAKNSAIQSPEEEQNESINKTSQEQPEPIIEQSTNLIVEQKTLVTKENELLGFSQSDNQVFIPSHRQLRNWTDSYISNGNLETDEYYSFGQERETIEGYERRNLHREQKKEYMDVGVSSGAKLYRQKIGGKLVCYVIYQNSFSQSDFNLEGLPMYVPCTK